MSWHFSQALVAEFSAGRYSDGGRYAPSKSIPFAPDDSCSGKMKDTYHHSPYGMMYVPLTERNGRDILMWFREVFLVKILPPLVQRSVLKENEVDCGKNKNESFGKLTPPSRGSKIVSFFHVVDSESCLQIWPKWGSMRNGVCWEAMTVELGIKEKGSGFSVPTIGANEYKSSSKVRYRGSSQYRGAKMSEGLRTCETDPIYVHPNFAEEAMGWPIMWTASTRLATDKFQSWQQRHGIFYLNESANNHLILQR